MQEILSSSFIVPLGAFLLAGVTGCFAIWRKVREAELAHDRELRLKEMEHAQRMKELELEGLRLKSDGK